MPKKDLWQELTRQEKRTLRRDLAEHFRLRLDANEAVLRHLRERLDRDPTMQEVGETRDSLMRKLEPEVRREICGRRSQAARQEEEPCKDSSLSKHGVTAGNLETESGDPPTSQPWKGDKDECRGRGRPKLTLILGGKYGQPSEKGSSA
jgi:hypothetical protein